MVGGLQIRLVFVRQDAGGGLEFVPLFVPINVPLRDSPGPQKALKPLV